jgi:hypothetical protein
MKIPSALLATALTAALSGSVMAASMTAAEATVLLERRGFVDVSALAYTEGLWTGTAVDDSGQVVAVSVDPVDHEITAQSAGSRSKTTVTTTTSERPGSTPQTVIVEETIEQPVVVERVIEPPQVRREIIVQEKVLVPLGGKIDKTTVAAVLHGAGYHDVHDIDWLSNRGVWKAEARDPSGDDREVHVDPYDGAIVHVEDD